MSPFTVPANLNEAIARATNPDLSRWTAALPRTVADLAARWSLNVGEPFQPGGSGSWVAPAENSRGQQVVLKVGWQHPEALHEAEGLKAWHGNGATLIHDSVAFDDTSALLLERCLPGTALGDEVGQPEQDEVVASLLKRLWSASIQDHSFRPLQLMCDQWADELDEHESCSTEGIDPGLVREGMSVFRSLPASADRAVLLCTDLHAGNILAAQREPWLVIDPKPYVGDPTYDVLQHMLNCQDRLIADPIALAQRMAALLDLDPDRLLLWLFARCIRESADNLQLLALATRLAPG